MGGAGIDAVSGGTVRDDGGVCLEVKSVGQGTAVRRHRLSEANTRQVVPSLATIDEAVNSLRQYRQGLAE